MNELDPLRQRVRVLEDQFRNLMTGEGWSTAVGQDEGVPGHWEFRYPKKQQGEGACCFSDGSCTVLTISDCYDQGGTFLAPGTTCSPNPCSDFCNGACCRDDGSCDIQRESVCVSGGGTWQGCGTDCDPNPCPPSGACCIGTDCSILTESACTDAGGIYQGDGSTCEPNPCAGTGACCTDGVCSITTEEDCLGTYQGDGTTCEDTDCTMGACCTMGICTFTTIADCHGVFYGGTRNCDNPCLCLVASGGYQFCGHDLIGQRSCCPIAALCCACEGGLPPAVCCDPEHQHCGDCDVHGGAVCEEGTVPPP